MSQSAFRSAVCCLLLILFPAQMMLAGETASAMLYTNGAAWLNGSEVPKSAAVFSGDMLQTRPDSTASIQSNGSSVMVLADSLVKFEGPAGELEHSAVRVTTSRTGGARGRSDGETSGQYVDRVSGDRRGWARADRRQQGRPDRARRQGNDNGDPGAADHTRRPNRYREKEEKTSPRNRGRAGGRWRNHEFAAGRLRRIGRDWRGYDLDLDTVGTCGESRVPVEFLPVILWRASSCREF